MESPRGTFAINELPIFQGLESAKILNLIQGGVAVSYKHRQALFRAGDEAAHFFLLLSGACKLYRHDLTGKETIVHFASPGDPIAGLVMMKPGSLYPVSAGSIGRSMALRLPRETWVREWASNALLQQRISQSIFDRMNRMQDEKALQRHPLAVRVAALLVTLLDRYSSESDTILPIPITRQEIADSVGSTVESVIRLMSDWSQAGILNSESRQIEVLRLDELVAISRGQDGASS